MSTNWTIQTFTQTEDGPSRLFQAVGRLLINKDLYKTIGSNVTPKDGSSWCVLFGEKKVLGFAVLECEETEGHLRYIYILPDEDRITAYRALIKGLINENQNLTHLWTLDHEDRTEMWTKLGFKKSRNKTGAWWYFERSLV